MKISTVETLRIAEHPNLLWVKIYTDEGLVGLGETFFGASAVEAYIHESAAPKLLGANPLAIDHLSKALVGYLGFRSTGAEMRGASAIDIALWDIFGKATQQPIWQLLGGKCRDSIRIYNTCAGRDYVRATNQQSVSNWGLKCKEPGGFDDLSAFLTRADELAVQLLESGITAMKIWPFDPHAEESGGWEISAAALRTALRPFERIRQAVGDRMDIMVEFHSLWQLLPAMRIAQALAPFDTYWHEDPIRMDSLGSLKRYAERSRAPVCASETLGSRWAFRDLLETGAAGVIMLDLSWCGGLSEARKIAAMAETWHLPIAPHDCTGPVVLTASTHLALNAPNALVQESVRAFYSTWYANMVTALPPVTQGYITVPIGPGLGLELVSDLDRRFTLSSRVSKAR
jgi:galactonate dehydratase